MNPIVKQLIEGKSYASVTAIKDAIDSDDHAFMKLLNDNNVYIAHASALSSDDTRVIFGYPSNVDELTPEEKAICCPPGHKYEGLDHYQGAFEVLFGLDGKPNTYAVTSTEWTKYCNGRPEAMHGTATHKDEMAFVVLAGKKIKNVLNSLDNVGPATYDPFDL